MKTYSGFLLEANHIFVVPAILTLNIGSPHLTILVLNESVLLPVDRSNKLLVLFANPVDSDHMSHSAASDLGLQLFGQAYLSQYLRLLGEITKVSGCLDCRGGQTGHYVFSLHMETAIFILQMENVVVSLQMEDTVLENGALSLHMENAVFSLEMENAVFSFAYERCYFQFADGKCCFICR